MSRKEKVRIGAGAGTSDDRMTPALELAERGQIDYLVFECLAERTVARENQSRSKDANKGYSPSLHERAQMVLPTCIKKGIRIVSNMGAANPVGGAKAMRMEAKNLGLGDVPIAVVLGDDVSEIVRTMPQLKLMENGEPLESILPTFASANAYLGADVVAKALDTGAPIVLTGRVADPSLFVGPMMHEFGWSYDDYARLAQGTAAGHLLECTASVTGGCFGWPGVKDVPDLANNGYPYADVTPDGKILLGKTPDTGGRLDVMTCTEQLIYEMHDPKAYITPDCVLDITGIKLTEEGRDRVRVEGAVARPRTDTYKVVVGYTAGYIGEGEVSYGGIDAVARARWAAEIVKERLKRRGFTYEDFRVDLIGMSSLHGEPGLPTAGRPEPYEVRLRMAGRTPDKKAAHALGFEVRAMHMHGPGGAGGACEPRVRDVLAVKSVLLPRHLVKTQLVVEGML
ncbi:MAG TPA: acyclic terpene utilization AtuA family protein [Burkholderiales bacterium]|jgi:hypothetical protein|nr:acyclic terpene utilization AtuA family protein [Burkholderiales bacterium]